jgi:hypothetical protein
MNYRIQPDVQASAKRQRSEGSPIRYTGNAETQACAEEVGLGPRPAQRECAHQLGDPADDVVLGEGERREAWLTVLLGAGRKFAWTLDEIAARLRWSEIQAYRRQVLAAVLKLPVSATTPDPGVLASSFWHH